MQHHRHYTSPAILFLNETSLIKTLVELLHVTILALRLHETFIFQMTVNIS